MLGSRPKPIVLLPQSIYRIPHLLLNGSMNTLPVASPLILPIKNHSPTTGVGEWFHEGVAKGARTLDLQIHNLAL